VVFRLTSFLGSFVDRSTIPDNLRFEDQFGTMVRLERSIEPAMTTIVPLSYAGYLRLDEVLAAQQVRSEAHDELLFIVIHQASELWLKLCLHELQVARDHLAAGRLRPAFKMLARVARVQAQLTQSWDVLATMTPSDYAQIRPHLGGSSGFQSHQYRLLEFVLGARNPAMLEMHAGPARAELEAEMARPSLYETALQALRAAGLDVPDETPLAGAEAWAPRIEAAWATIYRDPETHWDLYELAEKLVDLEINVARWRFAHLTTVERIIGYKAGTGGSPGVPYLASVVKQRFFPELMAVRTQL
jgi:tryptophan 2,3-dioxygenase